MLVCVVLASLAMAGGSGVAARDNPRDMIQAYRVWKLADLLDLSEEEMPIFFSRLRRIEERDAELRQLEREAIADMRRLLRREEAGKDELGEAMRAYEDLRIRHFEEVLALRQEALDMLTLRQRCQYLVFEEEFKAEIRDMIGKVREMRKLNAAPGR
jgi:hypothetical protein